VYEVLIERTAERDLKSLSLSLYQRIVPRLKGLADNPRPSGCHKLAGSKNDWRIRIGDYRVIYEIDDRKKLVRILG
jgi:mRNA interferase RelE/StbE